MHTFSMTMAFMSNFRWQSSFMTSASCGGFASTPSMYLHTCMQKLDRMNPNANSSYRHRKGTTRPISSLPWCMNASLDLASMYNSLYPSLMSTAMSAIGQTCAPP